MKISVIINTYNAATHLERVLDSVKGFDEVVVCDMESTDDTVEIVRRRGYRVVTFPKGECNIVEPARNFALEQASHPWVLVVDADEVVPEALRRYLYERIQEPDCPAGFYIPRKNYFMGRFMHCLYPDTILRFFKREGVYWPPLVHATPQVPGKVEVIPGKRRELAFEHLANDGVAEILNKTNVYTGNEVVKRLDRNYTFIAFFYRPLFRFGVVYFLRGGFRDGWPGFIKATLEAYYQFIILAKLKERNNF